MRLKLYDNFNIMIDPKIKFKVQDNLFSKKSGETLQVVVLNDTNEDCYYELEGPSRLILNYLEVSMTKSEVLERLSRDLGEETSDLESSLDELLMQLLSYNIIRHV